MYIVHFKHKNDDKSGKKVRRRWGSIKEREDTQRKGWNRGLYVIKIMFMNYTSDRASYIILDYLQALTPKYAHNTKKPGIFCKNIFLNNSFFLSLLISPVNLNLNL